jgi:TetR/AcrR family transcriptional regulator, transcriptional repressor for nem operon
MRAENSHRCPQTLWSFRHGKTIYHKIVEERPVSDIKTAILDAAERRMQKGGFGGFSFREIAADVGIKSSSVHYHFPTKEDLAAAVVKRWAAYTFGLIDEALEKNRDPVRAWTEAFRGTAYSDGRICPCTVLGAASQDLPPIVAYEVKGFFQMCLDKMTAEGMSPSEAAKNLSTLIGALVVSTALDNTATYDDATQELRLEHAAA